MIKSTILRERAFKDEEDVKAILMFTEVNVSTLKKKARRNQTSSILESILMEN
jgi:transcriptional regulator